MTKTHRILARRVAHTLTEQELQLVTGGLVKGNAPGTGLGYNTGGPSGPGGAGSYDYEGKSGLPNYWSQDAAGNVD